MHAKTPPAPVDGSCTFSSRRTGLLVSAAITLASLGACQSQQATNSPPVPHDSVEADGTVAAHQITSGNAATPSLAMVANDQARREADGLSRQLGIQIESLATTPEWYAAATNDAARVGGTASSQTLSGAVQSALANANRAGAARGLDVKTMRVERAAYKRLTTGTYAAWAAMGDGSNMGEAYAPIDLSETLVAPVPAQDSTIAAAPAPAAPAPTQTLPSLSQPRAAVQTAAGTPLASAATPSTSAPATAPVATAPPQPTGQPVVKPAAQSTGQSPLPTLSNPNLNVNSATGATTPATTPSGTHSPSPATTTPAPASVTPTPLPATTTSPSTLPTLTNPGTKVNSATGERTGSQNPAVQPSSQPAIQPVVPPAAQSNSSASGPTATQPPANTLPTLANPRANVGGAPVATPSTPPIPPTSPKPTSASSTSTLPTLSNPRANVSSTPAPASAGAPVVVGDSPLSPLAVALTDPNVPLWFTLRPISKNARTMVGVITEAANAREATRLAITTGRDQLQAALGAPARNLVTDKTKSITLPDGQVRMYSLISCSGVLPAQPQ